jgi:hypothetical protein
MQSLPVKYLLTGPLLIEAAARGVCAVIGWFARAQAQSPHAFGG